MARPLAAVVGEVSHGRHVPQSGQRSPGSERTALLAEHASYGGISATDSQESKHPPSSFEQPASSSAVALAKGLKDTPDGALGGEVGLSTLLALLGPHERPRLRWALVLQLLQIVGQLAQPIIAGAIIDVVAVATTTAVGSSRPLQSFCTSWLWCGACHAVERIGGCASGQRTITTLVVLNLCIWALTSCITFAASALKRIAGAGFLQRMRDDIFLAFVAQPVPFFDQLQTGELVSRLVGDVGALADFLTYEVLNRLGDVPTLLGAMVYIAVLSWKLTLAMFTVAPLTAAVSKAFGRYYERKATQGRDAIALSSAVAAECFANVRTVKAFSAEHKHFKQYHQSTTHAYELGVSMAYARGLYRSFTTMVDACGQAVVLWLGAYFVLDGQMTVGELTTFVLLAAKIASVMKDLFSMYSSWKNALGSSKRVFQALHLGQERQQIASRESLKRRVLPPPPATDDTQAPQKGTSADGASRGGNGGGDNRVQIDLRDVTSSYPSRLDAPALNAISITLRPGACTALVGPSGSGKSTIASLILRLYDPEQGAVLLNGAPLSEFDRHWYHRHVVAVVSQEPSLFATTIRENISYGVDRQVPVQELEAAARAANAWQFIQELPEGLDTPVGERGVLLSGGQKQRIAIARAILMNPAVLLLDEATSALDSESERQVQTALDELQHSRTSLVVAHRLATVQKADWIYVLQAGRVVEQGTHMSLLEERGMYALLAAQQRLVE